MRASRSGRSVALERSSSVVIDGLPYPVIVAGDASQHVLDAARGASGIALLHDARVVGRAKAIAAAARSTGMHVLGVRALHGGERLKSSAHLQAVWDWLLARGADRASVIVAVGGGTLTDLAGFAAATFMRGVGWIAVPTTLLGMVDAAIGGKTAIDLRGGKNVAGAFWAPRSVVADLAALGTLARPEIENGLAEIIKAGMIADPSLLERLDGFGKRATPSAWRDLIAGAARVKVRIVASDPLESGPREALNLGHTLGHAIEHASRGRLAHGRAVAIGLRGEGILALDAGIFKRSEHARMLVALRDAGLPLYDRALDVAAALRALLADKKRRGERIRFTLPSGIGKVQTGVSVEPALARRALAQCAAPPCAEELEV